MLLQWLSSKWDAHENQRGQFLYLLCSGVTLALGGGVTSHGVDQKWVLSSAAAQADKIGIRAGC